MKVLKGARARRLCLLGSFALMVLFVIALSGPIASGSAYAPPGAAIPPPVTGFTPAPVPPAFNTILTTHDVDALLANNANHGNAVAPNVHIIDVRSQFEYLADVCPMQIALGLPTYNVTNVGHPIWHWPDGTYEESYSDPYWIGFYWAGVPYASLWNLRMEENPNFADYMNSLVADGTIKKNDKLVFLCQTGYRASWAAAEATTLGFTDTNVLYGGMLAWEDDWYPQYDGQTQVCANSASDPSPGDCPYTAADGTPLNGDPDNIPGPNARPKSTVSVAPWAYETSRLTSAGYSPHWDGLEPHVGVKPEWMAGMGAGDFVLTPSAKNAFWGSVSDYQAGQLSVTFGVRNDPPAPPNSMNYPAACGGAPAPAGSCEAVAQDPQGPAYNSQVVSAPATSGVVASGLPAAIGAIAPNQEGTVTVKFSVPAGVMFFRTNLFVTANDVADPTAPMGAANAWYFTYTYPGPAS